MQAKHAHYVENINKALDYIDHHLESTISLDEIALNACFSKFHFLRIFQAIVGETPTQYVLRMRLEKAASRMLMAPETSVGDIAHQYGFSDVSVFSRNFKKYFQYAPSEFKHHYQSSKNTSYPNSKNRQMSKVLPQYFCRETNNQHLQKTMDLIKEITVQTFPKVTLAYKRKLGPYKGNDTTYQQHREELFAWAASKNLLQHELFSYLILYHDNPNTTLNDTQKMSLSVTVPPTTSTEGDIGKMELDEGPYLVCKCELTAQDFPKVWNWIYGHWFPNSKYIPAEKPYFERYIEQPVGSTIKVEFCIPVTIA